MTRRTRTLINTLVLAAAIVIATAHWMHPREEATSRSAPARRPPPTYRRANA